MRDIKTYLRWPHTLLACTVCFLIACSESQEDVPASETNSEKWLYSDEYIAAMERKTSDLDVVRQFTPERVSVYAGMRALREAYGIPICIEGHHTIGRTLETDYGPIPFKIESGETLEHATNKLMNAVDGIFQWRWIDGVPFIGPPLDENGKTGTSFDTLVSLNLESVSVWEAFVTLARAIRTNSTSEFPLEVIQPQCMAELWLPPPEFTEDGHISLTLSNKTAREAACAIVKSAPIEMYFTLTTSSEYDVLALHFTRDGEPIPLERMTQDQRFYWNFEHLAVNPLLTKRLLERSRRQKAEKANTR